MGTFINITDQKFGKLTALNPTNERKNGSVVWKCLCNCDKATYVAASDLKSGKTKSCGCLKIKHGFSKSKYEKGNKKLVYVIWCGIRQRCYDEKCKAYKDYGAKGIKLYKHWFNDFVVFYNYIISLPNCPSEELLNSRLKGKRLGLSLDRINSNKDYKPGNLKWSCSIEQNNNKSNTIFIQYKGKSLPLAEAVRLYSNASYKTVYRRIRIDKWDVEDALLTPSSRS